MALNKNHRVIHMTPHELEAIRVKLGLSVAALSRVLGLNVVTIHNMRANRQRIRLFVALSLRWLEALWEIDPNHHALPLELRAANDNLIGMEAEALE